MKKKIFSQILKEFLFPFTVAIAWLLFSWARTPVFGIVNAVNTFSTSFFLVSWLSSQYFRVLKQNKTEGELTNIQSNLSSLLSELDKKTKALSDQMSGRGSYCKLSPVYRWDTKGVSETLSINLNHHGIYPIYDVNLTFMMLVKYKAGNTGAPMFHKKVDFGTINAGGGREIMTLPYETIDEIIVTCITSTRAGIESNYLRGWRNADNCEFAVKTEKDNEVVFSSVPSSHALDLKWHNFL